MVEKFVYTFEEADHRNKKLFGGKGASLILMTKLGFDVPAGIIIPTTVCKEYYKNGRKLPDNLMKEVIEGMKYIENKMGKKFGDPSNPLLVSVRSGAAISMPGMMDTVLNLGMNDEIAESLARLYSERFAYDAYRRFLSMFGKIVLKVDEKLFSEKLEEYKNRFGVKYDSELPAEALKLLCEEYKEIIIREVSKNLNLSTEEIKEILKNPWKQLEYAIAAVFDSWESPRARYYRQVNNITPDIADGTAVNIVAMVFGNINEKSATGVLFTRNPSNGENELYGEFLTLAQGEDVVAGIRTPRPIKELKDMMPEVYERLYKFAKELERHEKEVQDIEFTIEDGKLYMLQARNAKMNSIALIKTGVDMFKEGIITKEEMIMRVKPKDILQLLYPRIDKEKIKDKPIAKGLPSSPGAVSGKVVFNADDAVEWSRRGEKVILVREETKPDDVHGFYAAVGILTAKGGMTSHAAVVARSIGKPCVVGAEDIKIDYEKKVFRVKDIIVKEGDIITIDGLEGEVYLGEQPKIYFKPIKEFEEFMKYVDEVRKLGVRANADTPEEAKIAREFGAEGIGLLRTERMFRAPRRLEIFRNVIIAENKEVREEALKKLLPLLKEDFKEILRIMSPYPVTIRLFDPPLHEFLPKPEEILEKIYTSMNEGERKEWEKLYKIVRKLQEANPMMGHRGVRLGITNPEIYETQAKAIFLASAELIEEKIPVNLEIMIPQVSEYRELLKIKKDVIEKVHEEVKKEKGVDVPYKFGTMIEVVRACLVADELAGICDFFSFGTNDLTQATFSFSRDDAENKFLPYYLENKILEVNPFEKLDVKGVGALIEIAVEKGRKVNKNLKIGICGEHGGDPDSIMFLHKAGLDYVSASPYRILIARLAAAQASILSK
ncbi:MAG: pyruvate, phosphate dikinase [Thermoproteota archaeon]|jgi:pyruvate,orthophosphate dikinase|nr:pyruvate, phosphate dikinase [Thermoproteota archaeon]